ncbi:hypothetical protein GCM10009689_03440 [Brevibacterium antiquum]
MFRAAVFGYVGHMWKLYAFWAVVPTLVIVDSPQFSDLAARYAPAELTGTGLTAMNALGFAVSVISIVILQSLIVTVGVAAVWLLLPGPILGLVAMRPLLFRRREPKPDPDGRAPRD